MEKEELTAESANQPKQSKETEGRGLLDVYDAAKAFPKSKQK